MRAVLHLRGSKDLGPVDLAPIASPSSATFAARRDEMPSRRCRAEVGRPSAREDPELGPFGVGGHRCVVEARPQEVGAPDRPDEGSRRQGPGVATDAADEMDWSLDVARGPADPTNRPRRVPEHFVIARRVKREIAHRHDDVELSGRHGPTGTWANRATQVDRG